MDVLLGKLSKDFKKLPARVRNQIKLMLAEAIDGDKDWQQLVSDHEKKKQNST